jgi:two-component system response regulator AtoC
LDHFVNSAAFLDLPPLDIVFGRTPAMQAIRQKLERVATTDVPVLLQGETGTGKEICARLLHAFSRRSKDSLVKVSCPSIPQTLLETELFGYEKGAFTGAHSTKRGRVEQAHMGTLFLDEVGSLDLMVQSKLLQVLQDGTFVRVGGHTTLTIETRLVSVANQDLRAQVDDGTFRLDFLYRINAVTINLPPLRSRKEDIPQLVDYFLEQHARTFSLSPKPLSRNAIELMQRYEWPGNIRQLENIIRSYVLIGNEDILADELLPQQHTADRIMADIDLSEPVSLRHITKKATLDLERHIILKALQANSWNRQKTAKWLHISYRSLLYKLSEESAPVILMPSSQKHAPAKATMDESLRRKLSMPTHI